MTQNNLQYTRETSVHDSFTDSIDRSELPPPPRSFFGRMTDRLSPTQSVVSAPSRSGNPRGILENIVNASFPAMNVASENTADLTAGLLTLLPEVETLLMNSNVAASKISAGSTSVIGLVESLKRIIDSIPALQTVKSCVLNVCVLSIDILIAWWNGCIASIPTLIYRILDAFGIAHHLITKFLAYVATFFAPKESNQVPGSVSENVLPQSFGSIMTVISSGLGLICTGEIPDMNRLRYVNEVIRCKNGFAAEITDLKDLFVAVCRRLPQEISMWFAYVMPVDWWLYLFSPEGKYYGWIDRVENVCTIMNKAKATYDKRIQREIEDLYTMGVELVKTSAAQGVKNNSIGMLLKRYLDKIEDYHHIVDLATSRRGFRDTPFCVYMFGPPGTGKSFLSNALPSILASATEDEEIDMNNLFYPRSPFIPYWDGYANQFVCNFEDFAMLRNVQATPGEYGEFMNAVSNVDYNLPMADLKDKGMQFGSKVVTVTSNQGWPRPNEMNTPTAMWRRRHVLVEVTVAPPYRKAGTNEVDPALIPQDNSHWRFRFACPHVREEMIGHTMRYPEFIEAVKQKYLEHRTNEARARRMNVEMVERMIAPQFHDAREEVVAQVDGDDEKPVKTRMLSAAMLGQDDPVVLVKGAFLSGASYALTTVFVESLHRLKLTQTMPHWMQIALQLLPTITLVAGVITTWFHFKNSHLKKNYAEITNVIKPQTEQKPMRMETDIVPITKKEYLSVDLQNDYMPVNAEGVYNNAPHGRVSKTKIIRTNRGVPKMIRSAAEVKAEATDENALSVMNQVVSPNIVRVHIGGKSLSGLYVKGQVLICPRHLFCDVDGELFAQGTPIMVTTVSEVFRDNFDHDRSVRLAKDIIMYDMNILSRSFKDISRHFISDDDLDFHRKFKAVIAVMNEDYVPVIHYIACSGNTIPIGYYPTVTTPRHRHDLRVEFEHFECWSYNAETTFGDCGSPLLAFDVKMPRKLVGMHIASGSSAFGIAITQEMITEGLCVLNPKCVPNGIPYPVREFVDAESSLVRPQGNFMYMGCLPKPIHMSSRSAIKKSSLFDKVYKHTTEPAVLTQSDPRLEVDQHPIENGVEKYGKIMEPMDRALIAEIKYHLIAKFDGMYSSMERKVVSEYEAINGSNTEFTPPLVMDTSPGFPYNQRIDKQKGKAWLFDVNGTHTDGSPLYIVKDKELRQRLDLRWMAALRGERIPSLWIDTLKDETREISKIKQGKTRVFTIPPIDYSIIARRLCSAYVSMFYENCNKFYSAVGISPEPNAANEWTQLYYRLAKKSNVGFAGDYSAFDGTLHPQVMEMIGEVINAWYGDEVEYQNARTALFHEMIHTCQVAANLVYVTNCGNPSGNWITTPLNTNGGAAYMMYAWLVLAPPELKSLQHFEENVEMAIYGDDNAIAVRQAVLTWFNPTSISQVFEKYGIIYTSTTKDGLSPIQEIKEMTFLKRGFRPGRGIEWLPTIDMNTPREMINWIRKSDDDEVMLVNNINESLRFLFFYGKKDFNEHRKKILVELDKSLHEKIFTYEYYYRWVYNESKPVESEEQIIERLSKRKMELRFNLNMNGIINQVVFENGAPMVQREEVIVQSGTSDIVNTQGIVTLSQRETTQDSATNKDVIISHLIQGACSEKEWALADMTGKRALESVYAWNTADGDNTSYVTLSLPSDALVAYLQTAAFERFYMWNGRVKVHIQVNGTRFHAGRLIAYFVPGVDIGVTNAWHATVLSAKTWVPNVQLDASTNNVGVIDIGYYNPRSYLTLNTSTLVSDNNIIGTFKVQVLSQLQAAGSTSPTINFSVWIEFPTPQNFKVPLYTTLAAISITSKRQFNALKTFANTLTDCKTYEEYQEMKLIEQQQTILRKQISSMPEEERLLYVGEERRNQQREEVIPEMGNCPSNSSQTINNYGTMNDAGLSNKTVGNEVDTNLDLPFPTMDKPGYTLSGINVYRSPFQYVCNTQGTDCVNRLTLNQSSQPLTTTEHFSTRQDEMDLTYLLSKPNMFDRFTWSSTQGQGVILYQGMLGPMGTSAFWNPSTGAQTIFPYAGSEIALPMIDFVSAPFRFWKGPLIYRFDVVASQMNVGRIIIGPHYGVFATLVNGLEDMTSQYAISIDLSNEQRTFFMEVPYKAPTRWLEVCNGIFNADFSGGPENNFLGRWSARVQGLLVAPDNAPPNVEILVSICGGPGYKLYYPEAHNTTFTPLSVYNMSMEEVEPQSTQAKGVTNEDQDAAPVPVMSDVTPVQVSPDNLGVPPRRKDVHFDEEMNHLGQFIKRYAPSQDWNGNYLAYVDPMAPTTNNDFGFALTGPPGSSTVTWVAWIRISTLPISGFISGNITGTPSYTRVLIGANSEMGRWAHMYRFWRGSMRFKILWGNINYTTGQPISFCNKAIIFTSHTRPEDNSTSDQSEGNMAQIMVSYFLGNAFNGSGALPSSTQVIQKWGTGLAINVCPQSAEYHDIEVPFTTIYNSLYTVPNAIPPFTHPRVNSQGSLYAMFTFVTAGDTTTVSQLKTNGIIVNMNVLKAAGDDFKYGVCLGPPRMWASPDTPVTAPQGYISVWPDSWLFTQPSVRKLNKKEREEVEPQSSDLLIPASEDSTMLLAIMTLLKTYTPCGPIQARSVLNELKTKYPDFESDYTFKTLTYYPPFFEVTATIDTGDIDVKGVGVGTTKRTAAEQAAQRLISCLMTDIQVKIDDIKTDLSTTMKPETTTNNYLTITYVRGTAGMLNVGESRRFIIKSERMEVMNVNELKELLEKFYVLDRDWVRVLCDYLNNTNKLIYVNEKLIGIPLSDSASSYKLEVGVMDNNGVESENAKVSVMGFNHTTLMKTACYHLLNLVIIRDLEFTARKSSE